MHQNFKGEIDLSDYFSVSGATQEDITTSAPLATQVITGIEDDNSIEVREKIIQDKSVYGDDIDPHNHILNHYLAEDIARKNLNDEAKAIMAQQDCHSIESRLFNAKMSTEDLVETI